MKKAEFHSPALGIKSVQIMQAAKDKGECCSNSNWPWNKSSILLGMKLGIQVQISPGCNV